jgi:hypothetical protein
MDNTTQERMIFRRLSIGTWYRVTAQGEGACCARDNDHSPLVSCNTNYLLGNVYDARCSCCYLGHTHTRELHEKNLTDYITKHPGVIQ